MKGPRLTRRQFGGTSVATGALAALPAAADVSGPVRPRHRLYWGDLHNHNAVGYGQGSLERSIDLARGHLDFFAFTGHASWHDMPKMPGDRHLHWVRGFEAHAKHWPKTRKLMAEATTPDFVALLGYEWHSSEFGDYCAIFPGDQREPFLPDHADKLLDFAHEKRALAIPHHVGYKQGWRGANWKFFRPSVSPVVEVFSEHGCTESDRAPFDMLRHSNGGRSASNTVQPQLARGLRFGFVASSDDHRGYPGAYGEGVAGAWAEALTAEALFEAVRARRTCAATGDRIALEVHLNERPMGSDVPAVADRQIDVRVEGQDAVAMVELVRNGRTVERHFPADHFDGRVKLPGRVKCRLQYGWGPWAALALGRVCHWDLTVRLRGGRFLRPTGCFQSAPFGEDLRDRLRVVSETEIRLESQTTRDQCFGEDPTKALVLDLEGGPDAELSVELARPAAQVVRARLGDLVHDNLVAFTGPFTSESLILHRPTGPEEWAAAVRWHDRRKAAAGPDWYYVRVTQHNGHMGWSSPIWVG